MLQLFVAMSSVDLQDQITKSGCFCLNESASAPHSNLFVGDHTQVLRSDADEQLIIHIEFLQTMKLSSLSLGLPSDESCPQTIKLFCNNRNLGFSQAAGNFHGFGRKSLNHYQMKPLHKR